MPGSKRSISGGRSMPDILEVEGLHTYYGTTHILHGVTFSIAQGQVAALLGRNGMGKTTVVRSIWGVVPPREGIVRFKDSIISGLKLYQIAHAGIGVVPQGKLIFPSLTVKENLTMAARKGSWTLQRVHGLFPILAQRSNLRGHLLSGGEQQMLSIARALMTNPQLLLMDEPSEGLAPMVVWQIADAIRQMNREGLSILLVEQHFRMAMDVAEYVFILSKGQIVYHSTPGALEENQEIKMKHLAVA
jgi:branched-chain amino acid transport system ATP-binding protein